MSCTSGVTTAKSVDRELVELGCRVFGYREGEVERGGLAVELTLRDGSLGGRRLSGSHDWTLVEWEREMRLTRARERW